ncbi:MAG: NAD(P)-dependent oxidoreductase [Pseudomonadota bacterium]
MKTFPMFLKVAGRRVVIVGGGEQAAQKARLVLKTEADLVLVAPELDPELRDLIETGRACLADGASADIFQSCGLVFVATGCKGADAAWHARAKAAGALVNVVDYPELCDAMTPSIVDRDPVVVAIGTEGTAPLLGRTIKTRIEEMLHTRLGAYAAMAGRLRAEVAHRIAATDRRAFWRWMFTGAPWQAFSSGQERGSVQAIKQAIQGGYRAETGHLCVVHGASAAGLIPMVAVQRLQEADVIYMDRDVPACVLELARRDAERVTVNVDGGPAPLGAGIAQICYRAASERNVVYLSRSSEPWCSASVDGLPVEQYLCAQALRPDRAQKAEQSAVS